mmetsp:Transcript_56655/g.143605  ORF Transcript_56655/g.143605 Transcript_56655/m.143605 type:complete len:252 (+) Transcript_56655:580-1335(+)
MADGHDWDGVVHGRTPCGGPHATPCTETCPTEGAAGVTGRPYVVPTWQNCWRCCGAAPDGAVPGGVRAEGLSSRPCVCCGVAKACTSTTSSGLPCAPRAGVVWPPSALQCPSPWPVRGSGTSGKGIDFLRCSPPEADLRFADVDGDRSRSCNRSSSFEKACSIGDCCCRCPSSEPGGRPRYRCRLDRSRLGPVPPRSRRAERCCCSSASSSSTSTRSWSRGLGSSPQKVSMTKLAESDMDRDQDARLECLN